MNTFATWSKSHVQMGNYMQSLITFRQALGIAVALAINLIMIPFILIVCMGMAFDFQCQRLDYVLRWCERICDYVFPY